MATEQEILQVAELIRRKSEVENELKRVVNILQSIEDRYTEILADTNMTGIIEGLGVSKTSIQVNKSKFKETKDLLKGKGY